MPGAGLLAPESLRPDHVLQDFRSREPALDAWLARHALRNEAQRTSRTFVVCTAGTARVVGFYTLALGSVQRAAAVKRMQRNAPDPIPVMVLGRLAVDTAWERKGVGAGLLQDALLRTYQASLLAGTAGLLVHCKSEDARLFYDRHGFASSPLSPLTLMLPTAAIEAAILAQG